MTEQDSQLLDTVADEVVALANRVADANPDADNWEIADGLLAGAVHWWLYTRQPCADPRCEDCSPIATASRRDALLARLIREFAESSDYYHSPNDLDVGRA